MKKTDPPKALGVFKPVGCTVIAFRSDADLQAAVSALSKQGFTDSNLIIYKPEEMKALINAELPVASPLASFGYEWELAKANLALAESGYSFLIVHAPHQEQARRVAEVARTTKAVSAQHYGLFMIEEITGLSSEDRQGA